MIGECLAKGAVEGGRRAEAAGVSDVEDGAVGGQKESLGMSEAQSAEVGPDGHSGLAAESGEEVFGVPSNGPSYIADLKFLQVVLTKKPGNRFNFLTPVVWR